jgi:hypothetical protein
VAVPIEARHLRGSRPHTIGKLAILKPWRIPPEDGSQDAAAFHDAFVALGLLLLPPRRRCWARKGRCS